MGGPAIKEGGGTVLALLLTAATFLFGGPIAGVVVLFIAAALGLVRWTPVGDWLALRQRTEQPQVHHTLNGGESLQMGVRSNKPQSVVWIAGIENPNEFNLEGVAINAVIPQGLRVGRCGWNGEPEDVDGKWLTTSEQHPGQSSLEPKEYWAEENITLLGSGHKIRLFKLHITEPGIYHICTELFGSVPKDRFYDRLEAVEAGELAPQDSISELIYEGERMLDYQPDPFVGDGPPAEWMVWIIDAGKAVPEGGPLDHFNEAQAKGPQVGPDYWKAQTRAKLDALYEIRRRLVREDQP